MNFTRDSSTIVTWILAIMAFAYVAYRGVTLSITHDEAYTFTRYVHHSYWEIIRYDTGNILPNNHILNTISQKFFSGLFGTREFVLRLGNVLTSLIFFFAALRISADFKGFARVSAFVIIAAHPYILDFMMLSRGYGMALAWMLLSISLFLKSINLNFHLKECLFAIAAAAVAVLSNFSCLIYFIAVCPVFLFLQYRYGSYQASGERVRAFIKATGVFLICTMVLGLIIFEPISVILRRKLLFGGEEGFWTDTVSSLAQRMAYGASYSDVWMIVIKGLIILIIGMSTIQVIQSLLKKEIDVQKISLIFPFLVLFLMIAITIMQHHFLGSYYPEERTALMYVPLFFLVVLFTWKTISTETLVQGYVKEGVLCAIALIFFVHMIFSANFTHVLDWKYDANTREISQDIEAIDGPILLGVHPFFQPSMEFYRRHFHLRKFGELHVDGYKKEGVYDVFVIPKEDQGKIEQEHLEVVKAYLPGGAVVAVRR